MASWLDYVSFPADTWADIQRVKYNTHDTLPFFRKEACGVDIEPVSNVAEGENVNVHNDPKFWMNRWDLNRLRYYFKVLFSRFKEANGDGEAEIDHLFGQLGKLMGGQRAVHELTWPCSLLVSMPGPDRGFSNFEKLQRYLPQDLWGDGCTASYYK